MQTEITLIVSPDPLTEPAVFCEVRFEGNHLKTLDDATLGRSVREVMLKAEEFIERKRGQINASRN